MAGQKDDKLDKINYSTFLSGEATDYKNGGQGAFWRSEALDFRQKASQMSVLPGARQLSAGLNDLITVMIQTPDGVRYGLGDKGWFYRISTSDAISVVGRLTSNGAAGMVYNQVTDYIYLAGQQTVSMYGPIMAGNPQLLLDNFGPSASTANGVATMYDPVTTLWTIERNNIQTVPGAITPTSYISQVTNTLTNTYGVPTAISEVTTNFCEFIPDITPFYSVAVWVMNVGTGDLTLTMHNSLNNNLGAVTITHANLVVGWNNFVFASPGIKAWVSNVGSSVNGAAGYHFHLSCTVATTTTVATINTGDLTGANFLLFAHRLLQTNNGWHPMVIFGNSLVIGNGSYLSTYDFSDDASPNNAVAGSHASGWDREGLSLTNGHEVCGLSVNNQMLAATSEKRSTNANRNDQEGWFYFWDGNNAIANTSIAIPMGSPYALSSSNNVSYFICAGSLFAYGGGQSVIKVRYIGYQNGDYLGMADSTIVNPNMMDLRYNILLIGYPSSTTNVNLKYGLYSWGNVELAYPNSFGYQYALSNGLYTTTQGGISGLQIGMIKNFVDTLYVSW